MTATTCLPANHTATPDMESPDEMSANELAFMESDPWLGLICDYDPTPPMDPKDFHPDSYTAGQDWADETASNDQLHRLVTAKQLLGDVALRKNEIGISALGIELCEIMANDPAFRLAELDSHAIFVEYGVVLDSLKDDNQVLSFVYGAMSVVHRRDFFDAAGIASNADQPSAIVTAEMATGG